jgi:hypothetical protein
VLNKPFKTKVRLYSLIALVLSFCLILTVTASLSFSPKALVQDQSEESISPNSAVISDNITSDVSVNGTDESTENAIQEPSLITQEQALSIAMPMIQQYAAEHNRIIISVNATFFYDQDCSGSRGGPAVTQLVQENLSIVDFISKLGNYSAWNIVAHFSPMPPAYYNVIGSEGETLSFNQYIPDGYVISMWADTSQIYLSEPVPSIC